MRRTRLMITLAALPLTAVACGTGTAGQGSPPGGSAPSNGDGSGAGGGETTGGGSSGGGSSGGQATDARAYATSLLSALNLPTGVAAATHAPTRALEHVPQRPSLVKLPTVVERFWTVQRPGADVLAWLRQHGTDTSLRSDGSGGMPDRNPPGYLVFSAASLPAGIAVGQVYVSVVSTGSGASAIGAYAVTLAQPPRPPAERVPLDIDTATIGWSLAPGGTPARRELTGTAARDLAKDFDALRLDVRGAVSCPLIPEGSEIVVTFTGDGHTWKATLPGCPNLSVSRDGRQLPALAFGKPFLADVKSYVGFLPPTGPIRTGGVIPLIQSPMAHERTRLDRDLLTLAPRRTCC